MVTRSVRSDSERVVILDADVLCALGAGKDAVWEGLRSDRLPASAVSRFDASALPVDAAAEVDDGEWGIEAWPGPVRETAAFDRKLELMLGCVSLAPGVLNHMLATTEPSRRGIAMGVGLDVSPVEKVSTALLSHGSQEIELEAIGRLNLQDATHGRIFNPTDLVTVVLAGALECDAFQDSILTACSSSSQAIGLGFDAILRGDADVVFVGGTDSLLNLPAYSAFSKLGVIQPSRDGPAAACRPCDRRRRGTLLGEGAGYLVLAGMGHALRNGLSFTVELLGYASTLDGGHITAPDKTGGGMRRAMANALAWSGVEPGDLDYVNLHGTGTRLNDPVELKALCDVLGPAAPSVTVSSTKDRHGHLIAAAGIMEAIVVYLSMTHGMIPRTVNLSDPVTEAGALDLVRESNREAEIRTAMSNSFAFGGVNTSLVFRTAEG